MCCILADSNSANKWVKSLRVYSACRLCRHLSLKMKSNIKYKIVRNKKRPLCDYLGKCKNLAYKEVYPGMLGGKHKDRGWSYLCRKHFFQEKKMFKGKLPYCRV